MEESRMEGRKPFRHGLLVLVSLILVFPSALRAESGPEEPLTLIVNTGSENPETPQERIISLLIDHPKPEEVSVRVPELPVGLSLDRVRTESRYVEGEGRWTAVEYRFIITSESDVQLGSFQVFIPGKNALSLPLLVKGTRKPRAASIEPRLRWERIPSSAPVGKAFDVILLLEDFPQNGRKALPEALIETPENVLLQMLPLNEKEKSQNAIAHVRLTGLQAPRMALPLASLSIGSRILRSEAGFVSLSGVAKQEKLAGNLQKEPAVADTSRASQKKLVGALPPMPKVPAFLQDEVAGLYAKVSGLWRQQNYVAALALLRATERDKIEGYAIRSLRQGAERELGTKLGRDEIYAPAKLLYSLAAILIVLALFVVLRILLGVTKGKARLLFLCSILFLSGLSLVGFRLAVQLDSALMLGRGRSAVVRDCNAYRVPDAGSAMACSFSEGERLRLREQTETWTYAEADDGRSGWIENSRFIHY